MVYKISKVNLYSLATILMNFGTSFSYFMIILYQSTLNDASVNSIFSACYTIVILLTTFLFGKYLDGCNKFRALITLQIISGSFLIGYGFLLNKTFNRVIVFLLFMLFAGLNGSISNASGTMTPFVASNPDEIYQVNMNIQIGTRLSGALIGVMSAWFVNRNLYYVSLYVNAATCFVSAFLFHSLFSREESLASDREITTSQNGKKGVDKNKENKSYLAYLRYLIDNKQLLFYFIAIATINLSFTPINTMLPYCFSDNGWGTKYVGYVNTFYDIGGLCAIVFLSIAGLQTKYGLISQLSTQMVFSIC